MREPAVAFGQPRRGDVAAAVATDGGAAVETFDRLAELPAFDPDRSDEPDAVAAGWRAQVDRADAVLVAAPEYAGGLAGAVKNVVDWLVATVALYRTPVAVISVGTTGGPHALVELAQTLTWQGAYVVGALGIAAPWSKSDEEGRFTDAPTLAAIRELTEQLLGAASAPERRWPPPRRTWWPGSGSTPGTCPRRRDAQPRGMSAS